MEIYDVINSICRITNTNYVLHRNMQVQKVKVYKKFVYDLHKITSVDEVVFHREYLLKAPTDKFEEIWLSIDKEYLDELLKFIFYGNE